MGEIMPDSKIDRRSFLLGPALTGSWLMLAPAAWPSPRGKASRQGQGESQQNTVVRIKGGPCTLEWSPKDDRFVLRDKEGRMVTAGSMQPAIAVARGTESQSAMCLPGHVASL